MKQRTLLVVLLVTLALGLSVMMVDAQGTAAGRQKVAVALAGTGLTYQGQLKNNSALVNGTCEFQFGLWDALTLGGQVGNTQTISSAVTNGLFTVQLNAGGQITTGTAFNGDARWLVSTVRCPSGTGSYTALNPRQALTPAPMAFALPGFYTQQNATSPNIIGGYSGEPGFSGNTVLPGVVGATISGGGSLASENRVFDNFGTVAGGANNTAGDGIGTTTDKTNATVGGGSANSASNKNATVGGGSSNNASGNHATIGGGQQNNASNTYATVGGGEFNTASGLYATVPGGISNHATMSHTFAAGRQAEANHIGTFVWADSNNNGVSGATFPSMA